MNIYVKWLEMGRKQPGSPKLKKGAEWCCFILFKVHETGFALNFSTFTSHVMTSVVPFWVNVRFGTVEGWPHTYIILRKRGTEWACSLSKNIHNILCVRGGGTSTRPFIHYKMRRWCGKAHRDGCVFRTPFIQPIFHFNWK